MEEDCKKTINPAAIEKFLHFPPCLFFQVLIVDCGISEDTTGPVH